jgi:hypothetical protein
MARRGLSLRGGAYSHFGCRFDCPRGHRGKPHRREAAPGRGAPFGRGKAAAALARVVQGGPGPAARGRHVSRWCRTRRAPHPGARMSPLPGHPRPVSFRPSPRRTSTRAHQFIAIPCAPGSTQAPSRDASSVDATGLLPSLRPQTVIGLSAGCQASKTAVFRVRGVRSPARYGDCFAERAKQHLPASDTAHGECSSTRNSRMRVHPKGLSRV